MNDIQLFDFESNKVRALKIDGEPWFVGKDVAEILGYKNLLAALSQHVDKEDQKALSYKDYRDSCISLWKDKNDFTNKMVINESGVYSLIFASKLPNAKKFKHWVTSEVLPAIRKTGSYQIPQTPEERLALTMEATNHLDSRVTKVEKAVADIQDKAEVDEGQRYQLLQARKSKVISACGGVDSNYHVEKKARKVFSEFGRDFKKAFHIPRYDCLKDKKLFR